MQVLSVALSTSAYHRTKDVRISAFIIAELKVRDIDSEVLGADFVEHADNAALFSDRSLVVMAGLVPATPAASIESNARRFPPRNCAI
jgi:hypothetical protein